MHTRAGILLVAFGLFLGPGRAAESFDVVIRHGRVVDGTGNPAFFGDVAGRGGRVMAIGRVPEQGRVEIEATGLVVEPGFIDVHTHADEIVEMPENPGHRHLRRPAPLSDRYFVRAGQRSLGIKQGKTHRRAARPGVAPYF